MDIHLADELAAESVDNASNRRGAALADEVKVEHALHSSWLHSAVVSSHQYFLSHQRSPTYHYLLDETSCLVVEKSVFEGSQGTAWSRKATNIVVGREVAIARSRRREASNRRHGKLLLRDSVNVRLFTTECPLADGLTFLFSRHAEVFFKIARHKELPEDDL